MRLFPLLTALVVTGALYLLVMQRDAIIAFAGGETAADSTEHAAPADDAGPAVSVVAMRSVAQSVNSGVLLRGRTEAVREVDVRAETSGQVISEPQRKGAQVAAGDLLCQVDPGTRRADLAEAEARLAEAEINNRAAANLRDKGFASETRAVSTLAALQSAEAAVERARKELERLEIHAPFGGVLESDTAELGSLLQPGSLCATVIQLDPMMLVGFVPETELHRVETGALAMARLATGEEVQGRVTFLARSADPDTRTFRVDVEVPNPDGRIRDGQTAEIFVASAGETAHKLPSSALTLNDEGRLGVRTVAEGEIVRFLPVTIIRDTREGVFVTGLPDEADVIVLGQEYVTDGHRVKVTYRGAGG
jgi:multidrug efflux system membrane fusion protein